MYAIIETGGKQYKAEEDMILIVEKLEGEPGTKLVLESVLMVNNEGKVSVGSPFVKGAKVKAEIIRQAKGPKIHGFNYKAKKNQRKRWGHRQPQTFLRVTDVSA